MRLAARGLALAMALGAGCAAVSVEPGPRRGSMAEIRALESDIEERAVTTAAADCDAGCRAAGAICEASRRICAVAGELADMDAMASCRRSEASCQEAQRRVVERCECPSPGGEP